MIRRADLLRQSTCVQFAQKSADEMGESQVSTVR